MPEKNCAVIIVAQFSYVCKRITVRFGQNNNFKGGRTEQKCVSITERLHLDNLLSSFLQTDCSKIPQICLRSSTERVNPPLE